MLIPNPASPNVRNERLTYAEACCYFLASALGVSNGVCPRSRLAGPHPVCIANRTPLWPSMGTMTLAACRTFRPEPQGVTISLGARAVSDAVLRILAGRGPSQVVRRVVGLAAIVMRNLMGGGRPVTVEGGAYKLMNKARLVPSLDKQVHARIAGAAANRLGQHLKSAPALVRNGAANPPQRRDLIVGRYRDFFPIFHSLVVSIIASNCKRLRSNT